jgi:hypothetical protein
MGLLKKAAVHRKHFSRPAFFKDKNGQIVLWQWPNIPIIGWAVLKLLSLMVGRGMFNSGLGQLSMALLFVWAYLELIHGVNYFRRLLGLLVLVGVVASYFRTSML